jgi:chemotaxis protein MotB
VKRKKRQGRVSHERWLVSYADFITLLFAFFVVLFATGQSDRRKKVELAASIQSAFREMGIFEPHRPIMARGASLATPESMVMVKQHIEQAVRPEIDQGVVAVYQSGGNLVISLEEAGFFDSASAGIRSSAVPVLDRIAVALPECALRVEGHTDNIPIHTSQFASNWELSSSRASSIARLLLVHANVHAENMSVAGYAEFHPAASNSTAEGRARNRRVDLVLLADMH